MSETIKLIIEIPKEAKEYFDKPVSDDFKYSYYDHDGIIGKVIRNGIPLDGAEIKKKCDRINSIASVLRYLQHREIQELLCEILDSIGRAENE